MVGDFWEHCKLQEDSKILVNVVHDDDDGENEERTRWEY